MANNFRTPGVYVQEISKLPPSIAAVETAIPAFIGYTEKVELRGKELKPGDTGFSQPIRIRSLSEYAQVFGGPKPYPFGPGPEDDDNKKIAVGPDPDDPDEYVITAGLPQMNLESRHDLRPEFWLYYSLQLYFANGGGPCYIVSVGLYTITTNGVESPTTISAASLIDGIKLLEQEDEPTMLVFPDAVGISDESDFYSVCTEALSQCEKLKDRVAILDIFNGDRDVFEPGASNFIDGDGTDDGAKGFRNGIGTRSLRYGAVYYPWLRTSLAHTYDESKVHIKLDGDDSVKVLNNSVADDDPLVSESLFHANNKAYRKVKDEVEKYNVVLNPSGIMAGIYALVDSTRGVWKAPANVGITGVKNPLVKIDNATQRDLNVHTSGKSINVIRSFKGQGTLVWGARTLAGNDNEWRYISVRRFFNFAEESIKKGTEQFVFEPNDRNTWTKVRGMIENFLLLQWRAGALQGATPEQAYFVSVGLPETMTALDILEGRMIVEIGMAVVRPAEFIILKFSHKMQES